MTAAARRPTHPAPVRYWINAARENSRWFVQLRADYRAEPNGRRRARLWAAANRCRARIPHFMAEARRMRTALQREALA